MAKLAVQGGRPVRPKSAPWPAWPVSDERDAQLLAKIVRSNRWSYDGPYEWKFAKAFTQYLGAKQGLCCANGTVAIQLALEALDIGAHDEVIVPGLTWQATAAACIDVNAVPILVDVEADTWCIDVGAVEAAITDRTKAVIVVHLYGCMADMTRLQRLCKNRGLFLIEDCAHQHGSFWNGKGAGSLGDVGTFSFQESKVLSAGEGGFNTCKSREVFERLYSLRNCGRGWQDNMRHAVQSGNYRITEFQAGILLGGLRRLDRQVKLRDRNAQYLNKAIAKIPGFHPMRRRPQVKQQSYFNFAFRADLEHFDGLANRSLCRALNAELSLPGGFEAPYQPLNQCVLYKPLTKHRHRLDGKYSKSLDPRRFDLPISREAYEESGMVIHHAALLAGKKDMDDVARALSKLSGHVDDLRDAFRA